MSFMWQHWVAMIIFLVVGFYLGKKYPSLFASVPGVNKVM